MQKYSNQDALCRNITFERVGLKRDLGEIGEYDNFWEKLIFSPEVQVKLDLQNMDLKLDHLH